MCNKGDNIPSPVQLTYSYIILCEVAATSRTGDLLRTSFVTHSPSSHGVRTTPLFTGIAYLRGNYTLTKQKVSKVFRARGGTRDAAAFSLHSHSIVRGLHDCSAVKSAS